RSLVSPWKRVAVSGDTVDGRVITEQELRDCAETYDRSFYTATIWAEHDRWRGAHGTVYEVRLVEAKDDPELEPGQVSLEARLRPNDDLLALNDQGKGLFSSIEVWPNFRNSGRCYLSGMAVTDEPASTRTQELYFSRRRPNGAGVRFFTSS
ncbi:GPO family capsid scaffolding protein, partial [Pseudomonas aeruginosa]|uniref:GPO family capsid scaffolding protein n=2 Tax=Pseudomonas TaxID=286 RepID=UPI003AFA78B6